MSSYCSGAKEFSSSVSTEQQTETISTTTAFEGSRIRQEKLFGDKVLLSDEKTNPEPELIQITTMNTAKGKEY